MILLKNCSYVIASADNVLYDVDILVEENKIKKIGKNLPTQGVEKVIDCYQKLVTPGLINCHTHGYQNLLKGLGDSLTTFDWCRAVTFPFVNIIHKYNRGLKDGSLGYAWGALMAIEMIKNGVTSFVSMDNDLELQFEAWNQVGIRGRLAINLVNKWIPKEFAIPDEVRVANMMNTIEKFHGKGLQDVMLAPNTPFSCTGSFMQDIHKVAKQYGIKMQIHVSETANEIPDSMQEFGMTPLAYLDSLGILDQDMMAVHGVHLTPEEMELCKKTGASVVYNPKSNGKLGSGIAPITELYEMGANCCLATDGAASNDLQDMMEDLRFGSMLQKLKYGTPARFGEKQMFDIATRGGAVATGIDAGVLEEGKLADIVIMNTRTVNMGPIHLPISSFVYAGKGCDVEHVLVDGKVVLENKKITGLDEEKVIEEAIKLGELRYSEVEGGAMKTEGNL